MTFKLEHLQAIRNIRQLVLKGFTDWESIGRINVVEHPTLPLLLFNYKSGVFKHLTPIEEVCRGLVIAKDGALVSVPFPKFYNYGEVPLNTGKVTSWTTKMDGSLILVGSYKARRIIHTRGGFDTPQAIAATPLINAAMGNILSHGGTCLFEYVSPNNHIVTPYTYDQVILIGHTKFVCDYDVDYRVRDVYDITQTQQRDLYKVFGYNRHHVRFPDVWWANGETISDIAEETKETLGIEGYVVELEDGTLVKVKTKWWYDMRNALEKTNQRESLIELVIDAYSPDVFANFPPHAISDDKIALANRIHFLRVNIETSVDNLMKTLYLIRGYDKRDERRNRAAYIQEYLSLSRQKVAFARLDDKVDAYRKSLIRAIEQELLDDN